MTKHSPAPWTFSGPPRNIHVIEANAPHNRVCFLTSDGPTEANAKLIAAAPELLAALRGVLAVADRKTAEFDAARAAVAKAAT